MGFEKEGVVYCLRNLANGKIYVGSTTQPRMRKKQHFTDLRCGRHYNRHLQQAFNKYGENDFEWRLLKEHIAVAELPSMEKIFITNMCATDDEFGYNMTDEPYAPMRGKKHTAETRAKMRVSTPRGMRHSNCRYSDAVIEKVFALHDQGMTQLQIEAATGVDNTSVSLVLRGKSRTDLKLPRIQGRTNNKSGCVGVYQQRSGRWKAEIVQNKAYKNLGSFTDYKDAVIARKNAERGV